MASLYYLVDGDSFHGDVVNVPYEDGVSRDFQDISMLDEATISLGKNIDSKIRQFNPDIKLSNSYFNVQYPYKKTEMKTSLTITNKEDKTSDLVKRLLPFAQERKEKVIKGKKVQLDYDSQFTYYLLNSIFALSKQQRELFTSYESMVSKSLKNLVEDRYSEDFYRESYDTFFNEKRRNIIGLLTSYTELRNIIMMLKLIKEDKFCAQRSLLSAEALSQVNGLYTYEELVKRQEEEKKKKAEEEARRKQEEEEKRLLDEGYYQYKLSDFFDIDDKPKTRGRVKDLLDE